MEDTRLMMLELTVDMAMTAASPSRIIQVYHGSISVLIHAPPRTLIVLCEHRSFHANTHHVNFMGTLSPTYTTASSMQYTRIFLSR